MTTALGPIEGIAEGAVHRYLGIRYAPAPVGEGRFRRPGAPPSWTGVLDASAAPPVAPQAGPDPGDEDCLRLSVTVPVAPADDPRPVVVWLHGGGFTAGSPEAPHTRLDRMVVAADAIGVTVGYRLGGLGWLSPHPDDGDANVGLLDQAAALRWVQDHIAAFGGDPGRVTVMGQSAGAMSAVALAASPLAEGMLSGVIAQSGAADQVLSREDGEEVTGWFLEAAGATSLDVLRSCDVATLVAAGTRTAQRAALHWARQGRAERFLPFAPALDPVSLPRSPLAHLAAGGRGVPLLVGANADECRIAPTGRDEAAVRGWLGSIPGIDADAVWEHYAGRYGAQAAHVDAAARTDLWYRIPALRLARAHAARGLPTWHYDLRWPCTFGDLGAFHGLEVRIVLGLLDPDPEVTPFFGDPPPLGLAAAVQPAWHSFVRTGAVDGQLGWPPFGGDGPTRVIDEPLALDDGLLAAEEALWADRLAPPTP